MSRGRLRDGRAPSTSNDTKPEAAGGNLGQAQSGPPQVISSLAQTLRTALSFPQAGTHRTKTKTKPNHTNSRLSPTAAKTLATQCLLVSLGIRCAHLIDSFAPTRRECETLAAVLAAELRGPGTDGLLLLIVGAPGVGGEGGQVFVVNQRLLSEREELERFLAVEVGRGARPSVIQDPRDLRMGSSIIALLRERVSTLAQESSLGRHGTDVPIWLLTEDANEDNAAPSKASLDRASIPLAGWLLEYECLYAFAEEKGDHLPCDAIRLIPLEGRNTSTSDGTLASGDATMDEWEIHEDPTPNNLGDEQLILFQVFLSAATALATSKSPSPTTSIPLLAFSIPACCAEDAWRWKHENGETLIGSSDDLNSRPAEDAEALLIEHLTSRISRKFSARLTKAAQSFLELSEATSDDTTSSINKAHGHGTVQKEKVQEGKETSKWLRALRVEVVTSRQELPLIAL